MIKSMKLRKEEKTIPDLVKISKADLETVVEKKAAELLEKKMTEQGDSTVDGLFKALSGSDEGKEIREKYKDQIAAFEKAIGDNIKKESEKADAQRRSIDETGMKLDGNVASNREQYIAKMEKSEKLGGDKLTDFDRELQKASDHFQIVRSVMKQSPAVTREDLYQTKTYKRYVELLAKAGYDSTTGDGLEWQPTILSSRLVEYVEAEDNFKIVGLFERIPMPSAIFEIPREDSAGVAYKGAIAGSPTESHGTTGKATFNANKIIAFTNIYYETEEDMIISAMPLIEQRLVRMIASGSGDAVVNGDDAATHMDSDSQGANDRRQLFDGLRRICQTNSWTYNVAGEWTQEKLRKFENQIDIAYYNEAAMELIFSKNGYHQVRNLAEVRTKEKFGEMATVVKGVLVDIDGLDVLKTSFLRDVDANGVVHSTTANNTKGQDLIVHKPSFGVGVRRTMLIENQREIKTQNIDVVASMRIDFQPLVKSTSTDRVNVYQARNVTKW